MSLESHIKSLNNKISGLDKKLHEAYVHHMPTGELKKARLHLLDELENLIHQNVA